VGRCEVTESQHMLSCLEMFVGQVGTDSNCWKAVFRFNTSITVARESDVQTQIVATFFILFFRRVPLNDFLNSLIDMFA
jgi:hypothetical protein